MIYDTHTSLKSSLNIIELWPSYNHQMQNNPYKHPKKAHQQLQKDVLLTTLCNILTENPINFVKFYQVLRVIVLMSGATIHQSQIAL